MLHHVFGEALAALEFFGFESRRMAKRIVKEFESLRNNLAHAQDIVTHDWAAIARIASRLEEAIVLRRSHAGGSISAVGLHRGKRT